MARWRNTERIENPAWVRTFVPEDWSKPDELELQHGGKLTEDGRQWHAERRWCQARLAYFKANPDAGAQELEDLIGRHQARRGMV